jgi:phosphonate transport system permease protein
VLANVPQQEAIKAQVIREFEAQRRVTLLRQRTQQVVVLIGFSALIAVCFHVSGFFSGSQGSDPWGRIANLLNIMIPDLKPEALFEDRGTAGSLSSWFYDMPTWLSLLWETVQIAVVATLFGIFCGFWASLLASKNLSPSPVIYWFTRRSLEVIRTLPDLIVALILVAAFGVGPLPGVIAIALGTMASLGKLYSEANEAADMRPVEAVRAVGGSWWAQVRFGVLPQVLPHYASYGLLRLEINVGAAAALGVVGAGGIGIELSRAITYTEFDTYFALLILIIGLIILIDLVSEAIRHRLIGLEASA